MSLSTCNLKSAPETRPCPACHHPPNALRGPTAAITSLSALYHGAESGCLTCSVLRAGVNSVIGEDAPLNAQLQKSVEWLRMDINMNALGQSLNLTLFGRQMEISVFALPPSKTPGLELLFPNVPVGVLDLPESTDSEASLKWVAEKLRHCDTSHGCCQKRSGLARSLPQRILDVGSTDNDLIRLKDLNVQDSETPKYACLSHCWGASRPSMTTAAKLDSQKQGIPWSSLPAIFQDTITYVRKLGIYLLWIDSLCIIQDDREDWRREAAKMASIYRHAYLVISASKSSGSEDRLSGGIDEQFRPNPISIPSLGQGSTLCFRKAITHLPGFMDQKLVKSCPLPTFNRGWIFQERLLSSRVLHFGPQELSWECLEESACQCTGEYSSSAAPGPSGRATNTTHTMSAQRILKLKAVFNEDYWKRLNETELVKVWHMLVEDYTKLLLTFESDIFPAISGIAKSFQRFSGSEYVAGMWKKSLLHDLAWHKEAMPDSVSREIDWHERPKAWRAPTWSWASTLGPVRFLDIGDGLSALYDIKEAKCFAYESDPTGELSGGHLLLRGCFIPTSIQYKPPVKQNSRKPFELFQLDIIQGRVGNVWADYDSSVRGIDHIPSGTPAKCFMLTTTLDSGSLVLLLLWKTGYDGYNCCTRWKRLGLIQISRPPNVLSEAKEYWFNVFKPQIDDMILVKII
ncbi:heterokaryon incompatibility domain-containing protein [Trichoderma ceciliae]